MMLKYKVFIAALALVLLLSAESKGGVFPQPRPFGKSFYQGRVFDPHLVSFNLSPSFSMLRFSYQGVSSKGSMGLSAGFEYAYLLSKEWSVATGVGYNLFNSSISLNNISETSPVLTEANGYKYAVTQQLNTVEKQQVAFLTIPIKVGYRVELTDLISVKGTVGIAYALPISQNVRMASGSVKRSAYFSDLNVTITELPSQSLGTYSGFVNASAKKQFKGTVMAMGGVVGEYSLSEQLSVSGGLQVMYGGSIKNGNENPFLTNSYSGAAASASVKSINPFMAGVSIGVSYRFVDIKIGKKKITPKVVKDDLPAPKPEVKVEKVEEPAKVIPTPEVKEVEPIVQAVEAEAVVVDSVTVAEKSAEEIALAQVVAFVQQFNSSAKEHFSIGSNELNPAMLSELENLASSMKFCSVRIVFVGHTCNSGSEAVNDELGLVRAQKAKDHLVSLGVDASRVDVESLGARSPKYPNDTEENRAKNRRVEIVVR